MDPSAASWEPEPEQFFRQPQDFYRPQSPAPLQGTKLFDSVRFQFNSGVQTLDNLLRYIEYEGASKFKGHGLGIAKLLDDLLAQARWLVRFLESAKACNSTSWWTQTAINGLRVELHQYSWAVMKITAIVGAA